ncbi:MAG TPA: hypothetical protein VK874_16130, partial [Gaiellaceae bacterium]|nr:hypothetical protein [Gaiellaceae bacterium]
APDGTIVFESTQDAVPAADLRITKTGAPAAVVTGATVTYTIPVVNGGPLTAPGVTLVDTLPAGLQYLSAAAVLTPSEHGEEEPEEPTFTPTVSVAGNVVTVALGDLPKGERGSAVATVTIVARATATGTLTNTAVVSLTPDDTNPDLVDPLPSNNTATTTTSVTTSPGSPGGTTTTATTTTGSTPGGGPPQTPGRPPTTPGAPQPPAAGSAGALITGTAGNDVLVGTPRRDVIVAGGGNDRIAGLGGNDVIYGGPGNDTIYGGAGNDLLNGGAGDDVLYGKAGNDAVYGGAGNDTLVHVRGEGVDRLFAGAGNDLLFARDGNRDWLNGGRGRDVARLDTRLDRTYSVERHR